MRDPILGSIHASPEAAVQAVLDHFRAHHDADLVLLLTCGPLETRILGERPEPARWTERVQHYMRLVREARTGSLQLVVAYAERDALVAVVGVPNDLTAYWAPRTGSAVGPWSSRRGDEMDLVPWLSW